MLAASGLEWVEFAAVLTAGSQQVVQAPQCLHELGGWWHPIDVGAGNLLGTHLLLAILADN